MSSASQTPSWSSSAHDPVDREAPEASEASEASEDVGDGEEVGPPEEVGSPEDSAPASVPEEPVDPAEGSLEHPNEPNVDEDRVSRATAPGPTPETKVARIREQSEPVWRFGIPRC